MMIRTRAITLSVTTLLKPSSHAHYSIHCIRSVYFKHPLNKPEFKTKPHFEMTDVCMTCTHA